MKRDLAHKVSLRFIQSIIGFVYPIISLLFQPFYKQLLSFIFYLTIFSISNLNMFLKYFQKIFLNSIHPLQSHSTYDPISLEQSKLHFV